MRFPALVGVGQMKSFVMVFCVCCEVPHALQW